MCRLVCGNVLCADSPPLTDTNPKPDPDPNLVPAMSFTPPLHTACPRFLCAGAHRRSFGDSIGNSLQDARQEGAADGCATEGSTVLGLLVEGAIDSDYKQPDPVGSEVVVVSSLQAPPQPGSLAPVPYADGRCLPSFGGSSLTDSVASISLDMFGLSVSEFGSDGEVASRKQSQGSAAEGCAVSEGIADLQMMQQSQPKAQEAQQKPQLTTVPGRNQSVARDSANSSSSRAVSQVAESSHAPHRGLIPQKVALQPKTSSLGPPGRLLPPYSTPHPVSRSIPHSTPRSTPHPTSRLNSRSTPHSTPHIPSRSTPRSIPHSTPHSAPAPTSRQSPRSDDVAQHVASIPSSRQPLRLNGESREPRAVDANRVRQPLWR